LKIDENRKAGALPQLSANDISGDFMSHKTAKSIFLAPSPRIVSDIFDEKDLLRLRAIGEVVIHEGRPVTDAIFDDSAADAEIIIGQMDLPESRLKRAKSLRAVFNVEGNFLPNIDYAHCFRHGIRVLNVSPVFAEPVAEAALGMAIDLARGITRSDRHFRQGVEQYGLAANAQAFSLFHQHVGLIGLGDLGRAILPLLHPFGCRVRVYDPWLPAEYVQSMGCEAASLNDVLQSSRLIFVTAGVTSQNQGFLGAEQFSLMQPGAALVLVSRAAVVDFDAMLDFAAKGHIRIATDVFPVEPLPASDRARHTDNTILCAHQAGAMEAAIKRIGKLVVADAELIARGLPPILCKVAQPETVALFRNRPVRET
jgi:phosphoglycerate dehydrogenase-like enzyme